MTKFLIKASYTSEGVKGLLKVGGTNRKQVIEKMLTDMGGKLESFYYAFGDHDVYAIGEMPDDISAAALSMAINASGMVHISVTILLDTETIDKAIKLSANYRAPGS
ncbi:MAG: GYD domain-containing protein [Ginsengibacter sp.]